MVVMGVVITALVIGTIHLRQVRQITTKDDGLAVRRRKERSPPVFHGLHDLIAAHSCRRDDYSLQCIQPLTIVGLLGCLFGGLWISSYLRRECVDPFRPGEKPRSRQRDCSPENMPGISKFLHAVMQSSVNVDLAVAGIEGGIV